jgi:hemerythrin-like metal-binding protein
MSLIEWKDEFSVGVPAVDHEHRELIGLINALHREMIADPSGAPVAESLGEIHAAISAHFALEEKIMQECAYAEYGPHKADHERLLDEIREIMDLCEERARPDDELLGERLNRWFTEHFRTFDARFHRFVAKRA